MTASPNASLLIARAFDFAARKHTDQRRKGATAEPYVNHLAEVAWLIADATGGEDPALIAAALLHDTVEDTDTAHHEIEGTFGADIAALVAEVTDDKSLPKAERKRLQVEKTPGKTVRARMLKLADKTSNLRSLHRDPPEDWEMDRLRTYVDWAEAVAASCLGLNATLDNAFQAAHR